MPITSNEQEGAGKSQREVRAHLRAVMREYQQPNNLKAAWQIANSLIAYVAMWYLMYLSLSVSWWLTIPLAVVAGGLLIRVFIIFHDCTHGAFFKSQFANDFWGFLTGICVLTSYRHWKWEHSVHHATSGDLDKRGMGDVWTMTVEEYQTSSALQKIRYKLSRNPLYLLGFAPPAYFIFKQRVSHSKAKTKERLSVYMMNVAVVLMFWGMISAFGFWPWLILQLTVTMVACSSGVWLFYVQHQFEGTYWERGEDWNAVDAALKGSSYFKLPSVLQWFSGNIGFHHIHHLNSKIPNYNLENCHNSDPMFTAVKPITLMESFNSLNLHLWDEGERKLISFGDLRRREAA